jgi:YD repeat-containing protein
MCKRLGLLVCAIPNHIRAQAQLINALLVLSLSSPLLAQAPPPGTATASAGNQGSALVWWNFGLVGGGSYSSVQVQHCSVSVSACSDPSASPTIFQGNLTLENCDTTAVCPVSVYDTELAASTTYVEKVTLFPSASNTAGQITSVLTAPFTTAAFPTPSISSFQGVTGSNVQLVTNEADQYYLGMNVYGCLGAGCTNFAFLGNGMCCVNWSTDLGILPLSPPALTVTVGGLIPATTYTVYVTAYDAQNTSAASPTFTLTTPAVDTTPPTTPANLTATAISPTEIRLSYGSSTDDLYLAGYLVQRCTGAGCTSFAQAGGSLAGVLTYDDTGLTPSTTYEYEVLATDGSNNRSPPSNLVEVTTLPGAPTALTASNATSTQVTLSWTLTGTAAGLAGYLIEQCRGAGCSTFSQVAQVSSPSDQITGLTPRTTYQFRVRSADPSGNDSGYSNIVTVTTLPVAGPAAVTATGLSDSQITLAWTASTAPGVSAYLIERCAGASCTNFVQIGSTPNSPYMDGGLLPLTTYQYRIRAQDASGDLSDYVATSATTITLAAPTGLSGAAVSTSQINLSWFASPSTGVTSYLLERCSGVGCTGFSQIAAVSGTSYSDTGLAPNTIYVYRVRGTDPAGALSDYAPALAVTTLALAPATNLTATAISSSQINLGWGASASSGTTGYIVQRCNGVGCNGFAPIASVSSVSYADTGLCASTAYRYRVLAVDSGGDMSAASNVASAQTPSGSGSNGCSNGGSGSGGSGGGTGSGSSPTTYVYDSNGHLLKAITNSGTTTYTYDAAGHVVSIKNGN